MIHYLTGNLLDSEAKALVNTVNTVGVMGKGIALQFKNIFPNNFKIYATACKNNEVKVGKLLITEEETLMKGKKIIINFPTKTKWQLPSEYSYIEAGLTDLVKVIHEQEIKSIAIPPLGSGNGGLDWNRVKVILEKYLTLVDCEIYIYEPNKVNCLSPSVKFEKKPEIYMRSFRIINFYVYDQIPVYTMHTGKLLNQNLFQNFIENENI